MNKLLAGSKLFIKRNGSTILTVAGAAGTIGTAVMAAKATPKAILLIEEAEQEKDEELTKFETVCAAAPAYIPSLVLGLSTLVCIFGANSLNKRQQAALTSAYALLNTSYKEYKEKFKELYGEEASNRVIEEIAKDKYEEEKESEDDGLELFYDEYSGRYFRSTTYTVQYAEYMVNREMIMRGYVYLNEFYEALGLEPIDGGDELGWSPGACLDCYWQEWVDFTHSKVEMEDGMECTIITMWAEPMLDFEDYC